MTLTVASAMRQTSPCVHASTRGWLRATRVMCTYLAPIFSGSSVSSRPKCLLQGYELAGWFVPGRRRSGAERRPQQLRRRHLRGHRPGLARRLGRRRT